MDEKTIKPSPQEIMDVVDDILKRGNDAIIRKKSGGYLVIENKKTVKYST